MRRNIVIAICLLAGAAGSAVAADRQNAVQTGQPKPACRQKDAPRQASFESRIQVYFTAHRSIEADLGV